MCKYGASFPQAAKRLHTAEQGPCVLVTHPAIATLSLLHEVGSLAHVQSLSGVSSNPQKLKPTLAEKKQSPARTKVHVGFLQSPQLFKPACIVGVGSTTRYL